MADIIPFPEPDAEPVTFTIEITQFSPDRAAYRIDGNVDDDPANMMHIAELLDYMAEAIRQNHSLL